MSITTRAIGEPLDRIDGPLKVRGAATYAFEWPVDNPAYLYPLQAEIAACHARAATAIPGVTCVKPKSALYMFPRLDPALYPITDDQEFAYELLAEEKVLIVQGTGFNCPSPDHFRVVFLPNTDDLTESMGRIAHFLEGYRRRHGTA